MSVYGVESLHRSPGSLDPLDLVADDKSILAASSMDDLDPAHAHVNIFIIFIFILELLVLVFVSVLEYFLRITDVFPVRHQNFSCSDEGIAYTRESGHAAFHAFQYFADVPYTVVISLCFALPPVLILLSEIAVWAFADQQRKSVRALCHQCRLSQPFRRVVRFIGTFLFGLLVTMIFTDVTKLMVGRLRPTFLAACRPAGCPAAGSGLLDEDACAETDKDVIRDARLSFPSIHASTTAFTACFLAIYFHHVISSPGVRVLRPFLGLSFVLMAVMCGLARHGLHYSHWTDVAVGFVIGAVIAVYICVWVLNNFHERLGGERLYGQLKLFLQQQRQLELSHLYKEGHLWYPEEEFIPPRGTNSRLWWSHTGQGFIKDRLEQQSYFGGYPVGLGSGGLAIPRPHVVGGDESTTDGDDVAPPVPKRDPAKMRSYQNTFQRDLSRTLDQYRRDVNTPMTPHYHHM